MLRMLNVYFISHVTATKITWILLLPFSCNPRSTLYRRCPTDSMELALQQKFATSSQFLIPNFGMKPNIYPNLGQKFRHLNWPVINNLSYLNCNRHFRSANKGLCRPKTHTNSIRVLLMLRLLDPRWLFLLDRGRNWWICFAILESRLMKIH